MPSGGTITHGLSKTNLYSRWIDMKKRCYYINDKRHKNYGGRGIILCDEWKYNFLSFYKWAINNGFKKELSIDRINNDGNYEPSNCRWVTMKIQQRNTSRNHVLTAFGKTKTIAEWAEQFGLTQSLIKDRINKLHWDVEKAITIKARRCIR